MRWTVSLLNNARGETASQTATLYSLPIQILQDDWIGFLVLLPLSFSPLSSIPPPLFFIFFYFPLPNSQRTRLYEFT